MLMSTAGDTASDLDLSDSGSVTEDESDSEDEDDGSMNGLSRTSSMTSISLPDHSASTIHNLQASAADSEFRSEVKQSLDRAFDEGHSVDNASVELKTLRMASNVPLRRVREAVVEAIVERIPIIEGDAAKQRVEITKMVARWGPLIDRIGGVDPVETVEVLAVCSILLSARSPTANITIFRTTAHSRSACLCSVRSSSLSIRPTSSMKTTSEPGMRVHRLRVRAIRRDLTEKASKSVGALAK